MAWEDGSDEIAINTYKILKTPFDWEGYDKPYWWRKQEEIEPVPKTIERLIQQGESNQVEFKTTLHFKKGNGTINIKEDISKTICASFNFLRLSNTKIHSSLEAEETKLQVCLIRH